jgi:hypothetical protein
MIFPLYKTSIYKGFFMAMLNNQMVFEKKIGDGNQQLYTSYFGVKHGVPSF